MTVFELINELQVEGWTWRRWLPKSARPKRAEAKHPTPDGYIVGQAKLWFTSGVTVVKQYVLALLSAEDLKSQGLAMVPHGKDQRTYQQILMGKFDFARGPKSNGLDVDAEQAAASCTGW